MSRQALRVIEGGSPRRCGGCVSAETRGGMGRGFLSGALSTASAWLVEPADATESAADTAARAPTVARVVIAVFGLARGAGTTVVARALAAELAARDSSGTAAVACEASASGIPLATRAAARLARTLEDVPGATTRAVGRLCLIEGADHGALADSARYLAPLVLDAGSASVGGAPASIADLTILVTTPAVEPALARVAAGCLARVGAEATIVLNRARRDAASYHEDEGLVGGIPGSGLAASEGSRSRVAASEGSRSGVAASEGSRSGIAAGEGPAPGLAAGERRGSGLAAGGRARSEPTDVLRLPESRLGAQLALGGREARGDLGRAIAALADRCEEVA